MIEFVLITLAVLFLLCLLYLLAIGGRSRHSQWHTLRGHVFAHRGLHNADRPENSLPAFKAAREKGYGIELDVHLLRDGTLAVFHDHTLQRMTGQEGKLEELSAAELTDYRLNGTDNTIPTFSAVLATVAGAVPLIIELKAAGNHAALVDATMAALKDYGGAYGIESFDPRCLWHLRRRYPYVIRGQLSQNFIGSKEKLSGVVKGVLTYLLTNFLTRPDFIAYAYEHRHNLSVTLARKLWGVHGVLWTLRTPAEHAAALSEGYLPIFENYEP